MKRGRARDEMGKDRKARVKRNEEIIRRMQLEVEKVLGRGKREVN